MAKKKGKLVRLDTDLEAIDAELGAAMESLANANDHVQALLASVEHEQPAGSQTAPEDPEAPSEPCEPAATEDAAP